MLTISYDTEREKDVRRMLGDGQKQIKDLENESKNNVTQANTLEKRLNDLREEKVGMLAFFIARNGAANHSLRS